MLGDWMINYQGGFVRRGLPGEVAYLLSRCTKVPLPSLVILMQLLAYGVLLVAVWRLVHRASDALWVRAFVFSPATLAFPVLDFVGGFRKEILLLAALAWLVLMLAGGRMTGWAVALYCAVSAAALVLSHEALLLFLPYWLAALAVSSRSLWRAAWLMLPAAMTGGVCWFAVLTHPGNAGVAARVCTSLGRSTQDLCSGAVAALAQTRGEAHGYVLGMVAARHPVGMYAGLAVLALAPGAWALAQMFGSRRRRWIASVITVCAAASLACSGVLFWYAMDWGRWMYIHAFSLFLVLLLADLTTPAETQQTRIPWWQYPCLVVYATTWNLPHMPRALPPTGYVGLVHALLKSQD